MTKSAEAFRTISEVAEWLDTPTHVLRFWESKFSQIKPVKRAGGRRYYRPQDMLLIGGIKTLLHSDGLTIKSVQKVLLEQGQKHVCNLSKPLVGSRTVPETKVAETADAESDAPVNKAGWKPIGLTKLATDLGKDGKMVESKPMELDVRDLAIKQIDAQGKLAVEESIASDSTNTGKAFEPSDVPSGAYGKGISDMNQGVISDLNSQASGTAKVSPEKSKLASITETKKQLDMFNDDQPLLNFWASDGDTSGSESVKNTGETADQERAVPAELDLPTLNENSKPAHAVHLSEKLEPDNRVIDQAEHQEMDQVLQLENVAINASGQDEVSGSLVAGSAVSTHVDGLVTADNVAKNAKLLEDETVQTLVGATLRSIGDHLDRRPIVSPLQAKALRLGLTALEDAIAKRRLPASKE